MESSCPGCSGNKLLVGSAEDWLDLELEREEVTRFNDDSWVELERAADKMVSLFINKRK